MRVADIIEPSRVRVGVPAASKKAVLELLAELVAEGADALPPAEVFDGLVARERLGSTGLGHGVAIPHCRVGGMQSARGALVRTSAPVEFEAIDGSPVDLFFALAVPQQATQEHLDLLAELAAMFSDETFAARLRGGSGASELCRLLAAWSGPDPA